MYDVEGVVEALSKLSYEEVLAYWIASELEEARFYRELARRARNLGLGEELVKTFEKLAQDSISHARDLESTAFDQARQPPREQANSPPKRRS
ncbi:ferritin family protein [Thermococcus sp. MV11]|uniref:ferritin family protein n=1 Tax=Thermococcus sp. MV11 TaxID=1638267 RepID=UPI0014309530|nr:ferritin family protein [Thermococcus sp. MV11]NJE04205.1 hypothetical protein [Thermococcus sp. MV11]